MMDTHGDKSEREWAEDAYVHRRDPALWREKGERIIAPEPPRTAVASCRLPIEEFDALAQSARDAGESLSEFVRKAVALRIGVCTPPVHIALNIAQESESERAARPFSDSCEQSSAQYSKTLVAHLR